MASTKKDSAAAAVIDPATGQKSEPANIKPATEMLPSGAPNQVVPDVDVSHPAVDNDPRAHTSAVQNQIDFNDPSKPGHEVVAEQLTEQGLPTKDTTEKVAK